jgi:RNA polymerase sigma-70 factor (ECF subfamily)
MSPPEAVPASPADAALARRLLAGDEGAFDELFARAFPVLCRFALVRVGGDTALAEELAQATLCRAIDRLEGYRGEAALVTWLCTICRRQIEDHYARRNRRPPILSLVEDEPHVRAALHALSLEASGPEEQLRRREVAERVHAVLGELPRHYAEALTWKYLQDLSVVEIGARLELTAKATESLLTRAREAFRGRFASLAAAGAALARNPLESP